MRKTLLSWTWNPSIGEMLSDVMESSKHLPHGKIRKMFYFLKADKNHSCLISVTGRAVNVGDGLGMKVPCRLFFIAEEKYINILQEKFSVQL